jgi:hypothetical protein
VCIQEASDSLKFCSKPKLLVARHQTFSPKAQQTARNMSASAAFAAPEYVGGSSQQKPEYPRSSMAGMRSCLECRRRKIGCDKLHPCAYCTKLRLRCEYPQLSRAHVAGVGISGHDIIRRLERVEAAVESLKSTAGTTFSSNTISSGEIGQRLSPPDGNGLERRTSETVEVGDSEREVGRLVFEKGESRYVSEGFWASLDDEVRLHPHPLTLQVLHLGFSPLLQTQSE